MALGVHALGTRDSTVSKARWPLAAERRGRGAFASEQSEVPCRDDLRGDSARAQLNKGLADSPCSI